MSSRPRSRPVDVTAVPVDDLDGYLHEVGPPLFDGTHLTCPGCGLSRDVLGYKVLHHAERFSEHVVPVMKCPSCGHLFALRP